MGSLVEVGIRRPSGAVGIRPLCEDIRLVEQEEGMILGELQMVGQTRRCEVYIRL